MKLISIRIFTISVILLFGMAAVLIYLNKFYKFDTLPEASVPKIEDEITDLPNLTFCELAKNPEIYDGREVRLNAKITFGLEGAWFSETRCGIDYAAIADVKSKELWREVNKVRQGKKGEFWNNELNLTVIGKFKNESYSDGCCLTTPFQFEILKVEKVSKIN